MDSPLIRPSGTFSRREKDLDEGIVGSYQSFAEIPLPSGSLRERVAEGRVRGPRATAEGQGHHIAGEHNANPPDGTLLSNAF